VSAFLLENELSDSLEASKKWSDTWFEPFDEYERLDGNQPSPELPEHYPKVTDGTASGLGEEEVMRVWGQLQTGRVVSSPLDGADFAEWKTAIVDTYWVNKIIPNANTDAKFFEKVKLADEKSGLYGSQPLFVFPVSNGDYTGSDFILPYIRDVKLEPGKPTDRSCSYIWLARHYTKLALRRIIEQVRGVKGYAGWNLKMLQNIVDSDVFSSRTEDLPRDLKAQVDMGKTITFYTCFQREHNAPWYTIYPDSSNDKIVRWQTNTDIAGDLPIFFKYRKINMINPYGVSRYEKIGPGQNMLDFMKAANAYGIQQALDPAVQVAGDTQNDPNLDLDSLVVSPGNLMFTGNAQINWFTPDKTILQAFPTLIGSYKTDIMNLIGTNDGSVSAADSGNTQYSKVPASIRQQAERRSARDNAQRQAADDMMATLAKLMINIAIQNSDGSDAINITEEQGDKLRAAGYEVPEGETEILAEFEELKQAKYRFEIDPGSSKFEDDDATKQRIVEAMNAAASIPDIENKLRQDGKEIHWGELISGLFEKSGLDNVDKIITPLSQEEQQTIDNQEQLQAMQTQSALDQVKVQQEQEKLAQQQMKTQQEAAKTEMTSQNGAQSTGSPSDDEQVATELKSRGWSDEAVREFLARIGGANG
jgi:hypothetical protein